MNRLFNNADTGLPFNWQNLNSLEQIDEIKKLSEDKPVVIFKHSTRCGVSHMAQHQLERDWNFQPEELDFFYLDLIRHRPVSNAVAETFEVRHQSPQILIIKNGEVAFHTSHHRIGVEIIRKQIAEEEESI